MNPIFKSANKLVVRVSCATDFIHRIATQDCLMYMADMEYFGNDILWRQLYRYTVKHLASCDDANIRIGFNYEISFYFRPSAPQANILHSILTYFNFEMVSYTEAVKVPFEAYTRADISRLFRKGNKLVRRAVVAATSPVGDTDNAFWRIEEFISRLPEPTYKRYTNECVVDLPKYFRDLLNESVDKAVEAYHRPIVRGRDGLLYSPADMDSAMMKMIC